MSLVQRQKLERLWREISRERIFRRFSSLVRRERKKKQERYVSEQKGILERERERERALTDSETDVVFTCKVSF